MGITLKWPKLQGQFYFYICLHLHIELFFVYPIYAKGNGPNWSLNQQNVTICIVYAFNILNFVLKPLLSLFVIGCLLFLD